MKSADLQHNNSHRPYPLPEGTWSYYQEWNRVLFLHWKVPADALNALLPAPLKADTIDGSAWISLVPFTMQRIRPRHLPAMTWLSDFHEINLRTYVTIDGRPGVYFLNIGAEKYVSARLSRLLSGLPYEPAKMRRHTSGDLHHYASTHGAFRLAVAFRPGAEIREKTVLDSWLTERYSLYLQERGKIFRFEVHHPEWPLNNVEIRQLELQYGLGGLDIHSAPDLAHYSAGVQVLAWKRQLLAGF